MIKEGLAACDVGAHGCAFCGFPVCTIEGCPAHPRHYELENGEWVCSPGCGSDRQLDFAMTALAWCTEWPAMAVGDCHWAFDEDLSAYDTGCGRCITLLEGAPAENDYTYCPSCGRKIVVVPLDPSA